MENSGKYSLPVVCLYQSKHTAGSLLFHGEHLFRLAFQAVVGGGFFRRDVRRERSPADSFHRRLLLRGIKNEVTGMVKRHLPSAQNADLPWWKSEHTEKSGGKPASQLENAGGFCTRSSPECTGKGKTGKRP